MGGFFEELNGEIIVGDGAMGTMLIERGLDTGKAPENWVLENPEQIYSVHKSYVNAGAGLIETCTFGANRIKLNTGGLGEHISEINSQAVAIAREAAGDNYVAGSVGPTGMMMQPYGKLDFTRAVNVFKEQINLLTANGVDLVIIETMNDLQEMRAALVAGREIEIPLIAEMTFSENMYTLTGNTPEAAAIVIEGLGANITGVNCTPGLEFSRKLLQRMNRVTGNYLSVFANAGKPRLENGTTIYPQSPRDFTGAISELPGLNVKIIGGCCGTTPRHIELISKEIANLEKNAGKIQPEKYTDNMFFLTGSKEYISPGEMEKLTVTEEINKADLVYMDLERTKSPGRKIVKEKPLIIRCAEPGILEEFLMGYPGKPLLISRQEEQKLKNIAARYGAEFINYERSDLSFLEGIIRAIKNRRLKIGFKVINE